MARIYQFARYHGSENFATNNTLLLLGRIYQLDQGLFEVFLNSLLDGGDINVGPVFHQQIGTGGSGIPDAVIMQPSFKLVVETKIGDRNFFGKEEYTSHFQNEDSRILLTLSRDGMTDTRKHQMQQSLQQFDKETNASNRTQHVDITFLGLVETIRKALEIAKSRTQLEVEELLEDYQDFAYSHGLVSDVHERMHVFAINTSEEDNVNYNLYYNQAYRSESPHKFIGLYRDKKIKYVAEVETIVIPKREPNGSLSYQVIKGLEKFDDEKKNRLNDFFNNEGWGDDGNLKFFLFPSLYPTSFKKASPYGIMGPRHFHLPNHIEGITLKSTAKELAQALDGEVWE